MLLHPDDYATLEEAFPEWMAAMNKPVPKRTRELTPLEERIFERIETLMEMLGEIGKPS